MITAPQGGAGDAVSIELGETVTGFLVNDGRIVGRGEASGVWIHSPTGGPATFSTLIENSGSIAAEAMTGIDAGVRVDAGVNFVGELTKVLEIRCVHGRSGLKCGALEEKGAESFAITIAPDQFANILAARPVAAGGDLLVDIWLELLRQRDVHGAKGRILQNTGEFWQGRFEVLLNGPSHPFGRGERLMQRLGGAS